MANPSDMPSEQLLIPESATMANTSVEITEPPLVDSVKALVTPAPVTSAPADVNSSSSNVTVPKAATTRDSSRLSLVKCQIQTSHQPLVPSILSRNPLYPKDPRLRIQL